MTVVDEHKSQVVDVSQEIREIRDPTWILDRRNSGKLFWRRDSLSESERKRVKFRCDVEVLEFLRHEAEKETDWSSDEEDDRSTWEDEIPPPSAVWGSVCVLVIVAVITYQWFSV